MKKIFNENIKSKLSYQGILTSHQKFYHNINKERNDIMKIEMAPSVELANLENLYLELVPRNVDLRKQRPTYLSKEKKRSTN